MGDFFSHIKRWKLYSITLLGLVIALLYSCNGIQKARLYRVARDPSWSTVNLFGREKNMVGFSNELMTAISQRENFRIELLNTASERLLLGLDANEYDAVISNLSPTPVNQARYDLSDPFYLLGPVLVVRSSSMVHSIDEMTGRIIGISTGASVVFNLEKYPSILITSYDNITQALNNLVNNTLDGVILDAIQAHAFTTGYYADKLKIVTAPLTNEGLRLVTSYKEEEEWMIEHFNKGLQAIIADGSYEKLLKKWDLFNTMTPLK